MKLITNYQKKKFRVLHIGNIANNAYLNAKFLREKGIQADVISRDFYHFMSTPEWWEIDDRRNLKKFSRPSWYMDGPLEKIAEKYSYKKKFDWLNLNKIVAKINSYWPGTIKYLNPYHGSLTYKEYRYFKKLIVKFRRIFPKRKDRLMMEDIIPYVPHVRLLKKIFSNYDLIQSYGIEPIYALLAGQRPYIAFEIGTIRDTPFENNPQGRLTALAYRLADKVIITNPDNILGAKKMGLENFTYLAHPLDEQKIFNYQPRLNLKKKYQAKILFFSPSRQNWQIKGNDLVIKGFNRFIKNKPHLQAKLILCQWGQEVRKSKRLINKLKIAQKVIWTPPLKKNLLVEHYKNSEVILDQFKGYFGTVAAEAMAAAKPLMMWFDKDLYQWAFKEMPPVILAKTSEEIATNLAKLVNNRKVASRYGRKSQKWISQYHSQKVVTEKLIKIYDKL